MVCGGDTVSTANSMGRGTRKENGLVKGQRTSLGAFRKQVGLQGEYCTHKQITAIIGEASTPLLGRGEGRSSSHKGGRGGALTGRWAGGWKGVAKVVTKA